MDDFIGLFIALIIGQLLILGVAAVFGAVCWFAVSVVTRKVTHGRGRALGIAFFFPLAAFLYLEAGILVRDLVRANRGSDNFFSSTYHYPLADGYQLTIFEPDPSGGFVDGPIGVYETAVAVQVAGGLILVDQGNLRPSHVIRPDGSYSYEGAKPVPTVELGQNKGDLSRKFDREMAEDSLRRYLIIDMRTSSVTRASLEELRSAASGQGVPLQLISTEQALSLAASAASPSVAFLGLLFAPILVTFVWLLYKLRRLVMRE